MSNIAPVLAAAAGELIAYFILGGLLPLSVRGEKKSLAETVCVGFITAHAAAETVSVAAVLTGMTLTVFCQLLSVVLAVLMSISICINFSSIYRGTSSVSGGLHMGLPVLSVLMLSAAVTALAVLTPAPGDPTHIISQMTADI
ncbi:MAG: DUF6077 domain-containing protein, partial [Lachnospiraceae bacterium]|nr:DUF6077 domain-containing protein [Lachnospiraceae bacterium]